MGVIGAVREENASSVSLRSARASYIVGMVNMMFLVIDELNSMTYCVFSL